MKGLLITNTFTVVRADAWNDATMAEALRVPKVSRWAVQVLATNLRVIIAMGIGRSDAGILITGVVDNQPADLELTDLLEVVRIWTTAAAELSLDRVNPDSIPISDNEEAYVIPFPTTGATL